MTQGERIKEARKYLGLTLEKFGEKLGVGKTAISKLEKGENKLTDQMAKSICREFSISEEWLRTGSGNMRIPIEDEAAAAVSDLVEKSNPLYEVIKGIMVAYQKLDGPSREVIDQFILDAVSQRGHPQKHLSLLLLSFLSLPLMKKWSYTGKNWNGRKKWRENHKHYKKTLRKIVT